MALMVSALHIKSTGTPELLDLCGKMGFIVTDVLFNVDEVYLKKIFNPT